MQCQAVQLLQGRSQRRRDCSVSRLRLELLEVGVVPLLEALCTALEVDHHALRDSSHLDLEGQARTVSSRERFPRGVLEGEHTLGMR